jgi:hypothetical protein
MTAENWIADFAAALGRPAPTPEEMDAILRLASVAAHASERRAAPIACWIAASTDRPLDDALAAAHALAND